MTRLETLKKYLAKSIAIRDQRIKDGKRVLGIHKQAIENYKALIESMS